MSAGEIAEQQALYRTDPWGELRADWRSATVCYLIYLLLCQNSGKRPRLAVKDFLLEFGSPEQQTPAQLMEKIKRINAMFGGKVKKAKPKPKDKAKK